MSKKIKYYSKAYDFFYKVENSVIAYMNEIIKEYEFVRGSNKRAVRLFEQAKEHIKGTVPESIFDALKIIQIKAEGHKYAIGEIRLVVDPTSPVHDYAKYVEFGTGQVGAGEIIIQKSKKKYELESFGEHDFAAMVGWEYGEGHWGEEGFWVYEHPKTGKYFTTAGQRPNGFMFRVFTYLNELVGTEIEDSLFEKEYGSNKPLLTTRKWYEVSFDVEDDLTPYVALIKKKYQDW